MIGMIFALIFGLVANAATGGDYPMNPDGRLTPGSFCTDGGSRRYPQHIRYCERNVSKSTKWYVINRYNKELGFHIDRSDRGDFKIDHLIPLCAGGSNNVDNLWPQHRSVYAITDPLEGLACEKMARGRLQQQKAVELLMRAKLHLDEAPQILKLIESL